ncbi:MAG: hypothetical protein RBU37_22430 [Myxococcota bacterium]|jgi:hypothetical protein|nr:hypothetical protein [Myxococcota bacterium]
MKAILPTFLVLLTATLWACDDDPTPKADLDSVEQDTGLDLDTELPPDVEPDADLLPDEELSPDQDADESDLPEELEDLEELDELEPDQGDDEDLADQADTQPDHTVAVTGQRCHPNEMIGLVELDDAGNAIYVYAWFKEGTDPTIGEAALSTDACQFFQENRSCQGCAEELVCGAAGDCVRLPKSRLGVKTMVLSGQQQQEIAQDEWGGIWGELQLGDGPFALAIELDGHHISTDPLTPPPALREAKAMLQGDSMAPEGMDLSWSAGAADAFVFTHIHINHHVRGPTFTECAVDASSGSMSIHGSMLAPLAVVTGLEFQGIQHLHFAAAHTPMGCVEFRWLRQEYVLP